MKKTNIKIDIKTISSLKHTRTTVVYHHVQKSPRAFLPVVPRLIQIPVL